MVRDQFEQAKSNAGGQEPKAPQTNARTAARTLINPTFARMVGWSCFPLCFGAVYSAYFWATRGSMTKRFRSLALPKLSRVKISFLGVGTKPAWVVVLMVWNPYSDKIF